MGKEDNYMWQSFADKGESITLNGEELDVYNVVKAAFDEYTRQYPPPIKMKDYHFNQLRTLDESIQSLGNSIKLCRELAFESIRKEFYSNLPSREKCIWLIPDNENSLEFWKNIIGNEQRRIFKVVVDGTAHRASQEFLVGGTYSLNKWKSLAHSYWKGEESGSIEDEVLFTGTIKIIEELA